MAKTVDSSLEELDDVKWFVSNKIKKRERDMSTHPRYLEKSDGAFEHRSEDEEFQKRVAAIKSAIEMNIESQTS